MARPGDVRVCSGRLPRQTQPAALVLLELHCYHIRVLDPAVCATLAATTLNRRGFDRDSAALIHATGIAGC